jgi:hypothetical protein
MFGVSPAKNTVYTLNTYGSGQPYANTARSTHCCIDLPTLQHRPAQPCLHTLTSTHMRLTHLHQHLPTAFMFTGARSSMQVRVLAQTQH